MIRSPFSLALLALALIGCAPAEPQQKLSGALADGVLLPAYSSWHEASRQLALSAQAFCANQQELAEARQAFLGAQSAWAALQPLLIGPMAESNRAWQVQFWPDKKNLVARQVEGLLKGTPEITPARLNKSSVVVQGLSAYEYVLFDPKIDLAEPTSKARYCPLIIAIGAHQEALAGDVLQQWQAEDGMAEQLKSFPNERYAEAPEAVAELLRTQISALDGLKKKLGTPLGRQSKGHPQPYQAEAWRSKASLANLAAGLASAERIWRGTAQDGVQTLLSAEQDELKQRIDDAYSDTRRRLAALQRPLGELLGDEAGRDELNALYDSLDALHRVQEAELAKTLGIQLGFNAHDGD